VLRPAFFRDVFILGYSSCVQSVITWGFAVATMNIVTPVNRMILTSLHKYFSVTLSNGGVLHGGLLHSVPEHSDFRSETFHKAV